MARPMKEGLSGAAVSRLVSAVEKVCPSVNSAALSEEIHSGLLTLDLKDRVRHIIRCLHHHLPRFEKTAAVLQRIPDVWDHGDPADPLRGFAAWPLIDYVGEHGVDHFDLGLETLRRMTGLFTAEFAIRPFLVRDLDRALSTLVAWSKDPDESVRRLVSEGTRPLLPWGSRLPILVNNPERCLPLLETLRDDTSETVRRSVANHLNDHSKSHPEWVLDVCERWHKDADKNRSRLIRHATRTILKSGHPRVFPLLGYTENPSVDLRIPVIATPTVELGSNLRFSATLASSADSTQHIVVDFAVLHRKKNGERRPKVFKWCTPRLGSGESLRIEKTHPMKQITTRTYHGGKQGLVMLVNGQPMAELEFDLTVPGD
jgi:3-methyladenine DNA glycosylase AlkC